MSQFPYLKEHIFVCECDGTFVFLDASRNRYFTLSYAASRWLANRLASDENMQETAHDDRYKKMLVEKDVLTWDFTQGKIFGPIAYKDAEFSASQSASPSRRTLARDFPIFFRALLSACWLRWLSHYKLDKVFLAVRSSKSKLPMPSTAYRQHVVELAQIFESFTPFFFTAHDACFFRSLFLVRYLALHGIAADWVFAVRLSPFSAHSWVEFDHVVLNEDLDTTLGYHPIMLV